MRGPTLTLLRWGCQVRFRLVAAPAAQQMPNGSEDIVEHRAGETAGLGILLTRVVGRHQRQTVPERVSETVAETRLGIGQNVEMLTGPHIGIEGDLAQWHDNLKMRQQGEFAQHIGLTLCHFISPRLVARRGAVEHLGNITIAQFQAVAAMFGDRLTGEAIGV